MEKEILTGKELKNTLVKSLKERKIIPHDHEILNELDSIEGIFIWIPTNKQFLAERFLKEL
jgi:hypothetical protein